MNRRNPGQYQIVDIAGQTFHNLTAMTLASKNPTKWNFKCVCGQEKVIASAKVVSGDIKSCGCQRHKYKDLTGLKLKNWTVLKVDEQRTLPKKRRWICECICGNLKSILGNTLLGFSRGIKSARLRGSCGCLERPSTRFQDITGHRFGLREVLELSHKKGVVYYWKVRCDCGNIHTTTAQSLKRTQTCRKCFSTYAYGFGASDYLKHPELPKYLYLCVHPERKDEYKIGVAKDPTYRTKPTYGSLILLDSVKNTAKQVLDAEMEILSKTMDCTFKPSFSEFRDGHTEWRKGEKAVEVWYNVASGIAT